MELVSRRAGGAVTRIVDRTVEDAAAVEATRVRSDCCVVTGVAGESSVLGAEARVADVDAAEGKVQRHDEVFPAGEGASGAGVCAGGGVRGSD